MPDPKGFAKPLRVFICNYSASDGDKHFQHEERQDFTTIHKENLCSFVFAFVPVVLKRPKPI
jgi:hypothetical protein